MHKAVTRQVESFLKALGCATFDFGEVFPPRAGQARGFGRWSEGLDQGQILEALPHCAAANARGGAIYIRINDQGGHPGIILLDDLTAGAVQRLAEEGFTPSAVIETSPGNFQAWIRLVQEDETIARAVVKAAIDYLVGRFGADPRAVSPVQPGRVPGFLNRKDRHFSADGAYPWVRLRAVNPLAVGPASTALVDRLVSIAPEAQAGRAAAAAPETPAEPAMLSEYAEVFDFLDGIRAEERIRIMDEAASGRRSATAASQSEIDFATTARALDEQIDQGSITTWLQSRRPDKAADYGARTVQAAMAYLALLSAQGSRSGP